MLIECFRPVIRRLIAMVPTSIKSLVVLCLLVGPSFGTRSSDAQETDNGSATRPEFQEPPETPLSASSERAVRVATFNTSLYRDKAGELAAELEAGNSAQAMKLAAILQTVRPDIVLLNEIDFEADHRSVKLLLEEYLGQPQFVDGQHLKPLVYNHFYATPVNTGVPSGLDINGDGVVAGPQDAWGYGKYEGQYGMAVLSRFPIQSQNARTFQKFLWKDLPNGTRPIVPTTGKSFYPDEVWQSLRLSSKSHWDVPIEVDGKVLHILASHPTPPAFDGPEDRNGCRNHDEILFWTQYIANDPQAMDWLVDDAGTRGGLNTNASFVVVGDLNADPKDGSGLRSGIKGLLGHSRTSDTKPSSKGAVIASQKLGRANALHHGNPALDTSQFSPASVGNLRVDYCIPSSDLQVIRSGVYWPAPGESGAELIEVTDHRLVWCDLRL